MTEKEVNQYSPLALAYMGDAVFDLVIRTILVKRANMQSAKLHYKAAQIVRAGTQAKMMAALLPQLTQEEEAVYRRGHNANPSHTGKYASRGDYMEATGFEALIGWLYLRGDHTRMLDLIRQGLGAAGYEF
jgi:ribonuclease-3 family protein